MNRRDFVRSAGAVSASVAFSSVDRLLAEGEPSDGWRTFEVKTRVEVLKSSGATRVWLPAALIGETPFQKTLSNGFNAEGGTARIVEDQGRRARNRCCGISGGREAGPHAHQPGRDKELCGRSLRARQGAESGPRGVGAFSSAYQAPADRWHRESDGNRNHERREDRPREGARDLRVDR